MQPTDLIGDDVRLYRADCLAVLPTLAAGSVDAVVCDPPYGTGGYTARSAGKHGASGGKKRVQHEWDVWSMGWLEEAARLSRGAVAVFAPDAQLVGLWAEMGRLFGDVRQFVWCKSDPMPTFDNRPGYGTESILIGRPLQPVGGRNWFEASTPRANRDAEHVGHPYQKPLRLMRWLVRAVAGKGGLILDPFMGSGSTGHAAAREDCGFVGIESDPAHYATALKRLRHAAGQGADQLFGVLDPAPTG